MLVEPDLDHAVLAAALDRDHGLTVASLRFVPAGETSWCYQVTDARGGRWFLKLSRPGAISPARAEFALRLAGALAELDMPVPRPRPTRSGRLWSRLEGFGVALFELVDGEPLGDQELRDPTLARQVASLVATVHAATPALALAVPFVETFEVWAEGLRRSLAELDPDAAPADGLVAEARALVWPRREALLGKLERVQALGAAARSRSTEHVLCHGDLIGDNLLRDRGGRLWLVDWDGAKLAPRELDLALFSGPGFARFLAHYQAAAGPRDLDPDSVAFFLLRRNLDDLGDWLGALLDRDRPELQRHADLDGIRWCLSRWAELEARIEQARTLPAMRRRPT
jgi:spectinomycin phosphotransferase